MTAQGRGPGPEEVVTAGPTAQWAAILEKAAVQQQTQPGRDGGVAGKPLAVTDDGGYAEAAAWVRADIGPKSLTMGAARGPRELSTKTGEDIAEAMQREDSAEDSR
jgi:hypothetical protein